MQTTRYRLSRDGGRSTEALVEAAGYGYAHSCVIFENFPVRGGRGGADAIDVVLLAFERNVTAAEALAEAAGLGLGRPTYEDALRFGAAHPTVQEEHHRVLCLWSNAGRRELGLEGFDDTWDSRYRFAFVAGPAAADGS